MVGRHNEYDYDTNGFVTIDEFIYNTYDWYFGDKIDTFSMAFDVHGLNPDVNLTTIQEGVRTWNEIRGNYYSSVKMEDVIAFGFDEEYFELYYLSDWVEIEEYAQFYAAGTFEMRQ